MIRSILCCSFLLLSLFSSSPAAAQSNDYTFDVPANTRVTHSKNDSGLFVDTYEVHAPNDTATLLYAISIVKYVNAGIPYDSLLTDTYKNSFAGSCGCTIEKSKKQSYSHFKGINFTIQVISDGSTLNGYSISTMHNGDLYNISIITGEHSDLKKYKKEFKDILNSFTFR